MRKARTDDKTCTRRTHGRIYDGRLFVCALLYLAGRLPALADWDKVKFRDEKAMWCILLCHV